MRRAFLAVAVAVCMIFPGAGPVEIIPLDGQDYECLMLKYANGVVVPHTGHDVGQGVTFFGSEGRVRRGGNHSEYCGIFSTSPSFVADRCA